MSTIRTATSFSRRNRVALVALVDSHADLRDDIRWWEKQIGSGRDCGVAPEKLVKAWANLKVNLRAIGTLLAEEEIEPGEEVHIHGRRFRLEADGSATFLRAECPPIDDDDDEDDDFAAYYPRMYTTSNAIG